MSTAPAKPAPSKGQAGADPYSIPLDRIDVSDAELFETDTLWGYFERLRKEDPVHYCAESEFGPYWSVTRYNDIMAVDTNHQVFSSDAALGGITIRDVPPDFRRESFIAMDQPRHSSQRKTVAPMFTPTQNGLCGVCSKFRSGGRRFIMAPFLKTSLGSGRSRESASVYETRE